MTQDETPNVQAIEVDSDFKKGANAGTMDDYHATYRFSLDHSEEFWAKVAREQLTFTRDFTRVHSGNTFRHGHTEWFLNGELNACFNCVDRWADEQPDKVAIIWEGDLPNQVRHITYKELQTEVCKLANALAEIGVRKGDTVTIYMPMIPETAFAMLACTRLGAVHSVVFAGFSANALRGRIEDCRSKVVLTANVGKRGGKSVPLKVITDSAIHNLSFVQTVVVVRRDDSEVFWEPGRDVWYHELVHNQRPYCPPVNVNSEDLMFLLYTSGSTGKPKGMAHTTAGYLTYASYTCKMVFDLKPDSVYACVADVGWITGHSYIVYGPLVNGVTTFMFESVPTFPDAGRYWDMVQRHRINIFYTAPTAIRSLMKFGDEIPKKFDLSSLRVLGSVGEPINPEAWQWYHRVAPKATIVDTFWQTETGGHMISGYAGVTPMKPGSASFPLYGVELALLDPQNGQELSGNGIEGLLCIKRPWPGMARTIYKDHDRYLKTYFHPYKGYYFTGDGCRRDKDGFIWITGRVDDVINMSGHRLGTAEVESALVAHPSCTEAAVVGQPHDIKGEAVFCFVVLADGYEDSSELRHDLKLQVRAEIGAWATPDVICVVDGLPKTRSGKIMRRILRKLASGERDLETLGDVSTLADPGVVQRILQAVIEA